MDPGVPFLLKASRATSTTCREFSNRWWWAAPATRSRRHGEMGSFAMARLTCTSRARERWAKTYKSHKIRLANWISRPSSTLSSARLRDLAETSCRIGYRISSLSFRSRLTSSPRWLPAQASVAQGAKATPTRRPASSTSSRANWSCWSRSQKRLSHSLCQCCNTRLTKNEHRCSRSLRKASTRSCEKSIRTARRQCARR
mmetsp:Transcript_34403/g.75583  ORF Transcript_34403/g.75583 Transcript_34403/m.75583 type:complete len:200 (+) Transcript_34403:2108-2707(+)